MNCSLITRFWTSWISWISRFSEHLGVQSTRLTQVSVYWKIIEHLFVFLENSTLRRDWDLICVYLIIRLVGLKLWVSRFSTNRWRTSSNKNDQVHRFRLNPVKFLTRQKKLTLMLKKQRRLFHSLRVKCLWVKMSAIWCLMSMYRILNLVVQILSVKEQNKRNWVLDTSRFVEHRPSIVISITISLTAKTYNTSIDWENLHFESTLSLWNNSELSCMVGIFIWLFFRVLETTQNHKFPFVSGYSFHRVGLVVMKNFKNQIPKIQSWDTVHSQARVNFFQFLLNYEKSKSVYPISHERVLQKCTKFHPMLISNFLNPRQSQSLETVQTCIVVQCFPLELSSLNLLVKCIWERKRAKFLSQTFVFFRDGMGKLVHWP